MRCKYLPYIIILLLTLNLTFGAPTSAPIDMNGFGSNSNEATSDAQNNQVTPSTIKTTSNSIPDSKNILFENIPNNQITNENNSNLNLLIITSIINSALLMILIAGIAIYLIIKNKPKTFKSTGNEPQYENSKDSVQYTETFYKLESYIRTNLHSYSFNSIKNALMQQGFTPEEIDSVYYEITKK